MPTRYKPHSAAAVLLILAASLTGCGGGSGPASTGASGTSGETTRQEAESATADVHAEVSVRSAQVAIETYATEQQGSYTGATVKDLQNIEPTIPPTLELSGLGARTYTLAVKAASGETFTIARSGGGSVKLSCDPPGQGDCPSNGTWK